MSDAIFGPLVTGADVERWALDTLKTYTPDYLAWAERATGRAPRSIAQPRSWVTAADAERWPEEALPCVLLLSPGLADEPTREGRGAYTATFGLGLAVIVQDSTRSKVDELAKLYTAALRTILLQHPSLGGHADAVEWADERYDSVPVEGKRRQLAAGQAVFRVAVPNVAATGGPRAPSADPYTPQPDPPQVATTEVVVEAKE